MTDITPSADTPINLSRLPRLLREMTGTRISYQSLYRRVIDGDLPATQTERGRWLIAPADLPTYIANVAGRK